MGSPDLESGRELVSGDGCSMGQKSCSVRKGYRGLGQAEARGRNDDNDARRQLISRPGQVDAVGGGDCLFWERGL